MQKPSAFPGQRLFVGYYAATAAFLIADYGLGFNIRLSFLDGYPGWRIVYYLFCFACLLLILRYPAWTNVIAALESLVNVSSLILNMGIRVVRVTDAMIESGRPPVTPEEIFNFLIAGFAAYAALWLRSRRARGELKANLSR